MRKCEKCRGEGPTLWDDRNGGRYLCRKCHSDPKDVFFLEEEARVTPNVEPDYTKKCEVCGATPIVPETGMCGPCTFGEADTAGGNW